ncbi:DMT family transporter [Bacillus solitudinis]|uniref:DMT family transporter n=1 Tax=Bacillus solitudinis TaxID=2014074 RepID=UPI000C2367B7|nr:multidrug efflux SMR transporter [Bacillus solitudinis]
MTWLYLIVAGLGEFGLVSFIKLSDGFTNRTYSLLTGISGIISFSFLAKAVELLPIGVAYGIWTGIGSIGSVIIGMYFFNENKSVSKVVYISFIIIGVTGLKTFS